MKFIEKLARSSSGIGFFVQTTGQKQMLLEQCNPLKVSIVGMYADGLDPVETIQFEKKRTTDIVLHGGLQDAKGFSYFLELAERMPSRRFIVPVLNEGERLSAEPFCTLSNITLVVSTWETGLKELVRKSDIVICPSLWTAPIEGAVLKSLCNNPNVAVFRHVRSFSEELPKDSVIELTGDTTKDVEELETYSSRKTNGEFCKWYASYMMKKENFMRILLIESE